MDIWQHADGRKLVVEGMEDNGYVQTVVYNSKIRINQIGKKIARKAITPYIIINEGYGEQGRRNNARIRSMYDYRIGTREDAIRAAYRYMGGKK